MKVRVLRAMNQNCWYSECIGQVFETFAIPNVPYVWFSNKFFFYPEDVEVFKTGPGLVPDFSNSAVA